MRRFLAAVMIIVTMSPSAWADRAATYYHKAMAHKKQGQIAKAIEALQQAIAARKDYAEAHRSLGILYRKQGKIDQAVRYLKAAAALQPRSAEVHYSLGLAYFAARKRDLAMTSLAKAVELKPNDARYAAQYGILAIRLSPEVAIRYLKKAVQLSPESADYLHQLGLACRRAATKAARVDNKELRELRLQQAEKYLLEAARRKDDAGLHYDLAVLYRYKGAEAKAIEHYEYAVSLNPKLAAAWWDLGHVYTNAKQFDQAVKAYEQYLKLQSKSKDAEVARQRIKDLKGKRNGG